MSPTSSLRRLGLIATALLATLGLTLAACTNANNSEDNAAPSSGGTDVLATFTILADMASEVAGNELTVSSLTRPGAEIHGYDPTPADIRSANEAKLIISNGLGLEHWVDKLTQDSHAARAVASEGVDPIMIEGTSEPNPHAWMSPVIAEKYVDNITTALSALKPEAASTFDANAKAYKEKLKKVNQEMLDGLKKLPDNERALQTCEGAFSYLARDAKMKESYIWPVNSEEEITPQNLRRAAEFVKSNKVPAVFCESTVDPGPKEQLMRETGAADGGTLYVDSLTEKGGEAPTYLELIRHDTTTIVEGLNK
ncbi:metal ABC transporter solute-binding protein, Zn/Mn family [Corynebacterium uberis]|uniref:metal ABC transporter solute-binding protein, Zn/Mn family n=1 Tax=Corynebacterium TaxID=1716 RepID=UPI001D0A1EDF|nr:zinc ABC transporter substrate-binding protein [Corynebacterium uberis]MCZ9308867.1 zinc ABC transporter substrate-binding protein [Corynebacterium sp. c6VSa_13]UDL74654.1 zinc ABC transporter substrate-binding protein [Corynebacterium uberis]UDL76512.1 zinc ABC transporter substrate-binding protein [Corynebacterium uberis]UDL78724.1 zinc ABC transporter substrate-binding protein [Corynebacterium uberis]UDL81003.1 zinc ABC transporter substrate-binding protein [Corynebacterium uberis]